MATGMAETARHAGCAKSSTMANSAAPPHDHQLGDAFADLNGERVGAPIPAEMNNCPDNRLSIRPTRLPRTIHACWPSPARGERRRPVPDRRYEWRLPVGIRWSLAGVARSGRLQAGAQIQPAGTGGGVVGQGISWPIRDRGFSIQ